MIDADTCRKLFEVADEVLKNTYPNGKGFAVAVLTKQGNIYPGVSYKSDTYTLTMHSEAVALTHAATHGEKDIVAITGPNCHICKQLIYESSLRSGIDTLIILKENNGFKQIPISHLMPYPWPEHPTEVQNKTFDVQSKHEHTTSQRHTWLGICALVHRIRVGNLTFHHRPPLSHRLDHYAGRYRHHAVGAV